MCAHAKIQEGTYIALTHLRSVPDPIDTAFDAITPNSIQMDLLLGLLLGSDAPAITGWHQVIKVKETIIRKEQCVSGKPIIYNFFRTFDLIDGEELGASYKDRCLARHVTWKARVHWAEHRTRIMELMHDDTGYEISEFTNEATYFAAMKTASRSGLMQEALTALHALHVTLVRAKLLQEK